MSSRRTVNTTVSAPNYCCLFCLQKHGSIQKIWAGHVVKQVSYCTTRHVHKCIGLTKHLRQNQECAAYYSSNSLTWNRNINVSFSMLDGSTTHQQQYQPFAFGLSITGNASLVVACHSQLPYHLSPILP